MLDELRALQAELSLSRESDAQPSSDAEAEPALTNRVGSISSRVAARRQVRAQTRLPSATMLPIRSATALPIHVMTPALADAIYTRRMHGDLLGTQQRQLELSRLVRLEGSPRSSAVSTFVDGGLTALPILDPSSQTLNASHNRISIISTELNHLRSLVELDLSDNRLRELPASLGMLSCLVSLSASKNILGKLPEGVGELRLLEELDVSANNITELPNSLSQLPFLAMVRRKSAKQPRWP